MALKKSYKPAITKAKVKAVVTEEDTTTELVFEKGQYREYPKSELSEEIVNNRTLHTGAERILVFFLTLFALVIRVSNLSDPNSVVFDEVHFGGFAKKYIKGEFFMDVHPPLAKLLFAAIGYLGGFKGDFKFEKIGDIFPPNVPYVLMRQLSAMMGVGTVLFMYFTLRSSGCKPIVAFLTASLLVIENSIVTISRYILLDSPLLFFIAGASFFYVRTEICKPFSLQWFKSLILSGIFLGFALSSKWVGLFTVAWLGVANIIRLWFVLGDLSVSSCTLAKHFIYRSVILLGVPLAIYVFSFYIHIAALPHEGDGAGFMSSAFRTSFDDTTVPKSTYADVGVSSIVTLKHLNTHGGYLHSHDHLYEGGSGQQQVTLYPHLDENNKWIVELYNETSEPFEFKPITDGTKIRFRHLITNRRLHSHDVRPSVTEIEWQNEASCYGFEGFEGDPNDDFIVEIVKEKSVPGVAQERLRSIDTVFRLRQAMTGCYLFSHDTKLPKWGFEQQEVTCATQGIHSLSYWYIEDNTNIYLDYKNAERASYKPLTFFQKLIEMHKTMWEVNNGLTSSHVYESRPTEWLTLSRGISYWREEPHQIYLLGNPIIWYLASFLFLGFGTYVVFQILKWQLGFTLGFNSVTFNFNYYVFEFLLGWFLHYFPFFLMERQLFLHHYLPALYFAILALGHVLELVYSSVFKGKKIFAYIIFALLFSASLYSFYERAPIVYASDWTKQKCESSKWISSWDYDCSTFPSLVDGKLVQPKALETEKFNFDAAIKPDQHVLELQQQQQQHREQQLKLQQEQEQQLKLQQEQEQEQQKLLQKLKLQQEQQQAQEQDQEQHIERNIEVEKNEDSHELRHEPEVGEPAFFVVDKIPNTEIELSAEEAKNSGDFKEPEVGEPDFFVVDEIPDIHHDESVENIVAVTPEENATPHTHEETSTVAEDVEALETPDFEEHAIPETEAAKDEIVKDEL